MYAFATYGVNTILYNPFPAAGTGRLKCIFYFLLTLLKLKNRMHVVLTLHPSTFLTYTFLHLSTPSSAFYISRPFHRARNCALRIKKTVRLACKLSNILMLPWAHTA